MYRAFRGYFLNSIINSQLRRRVAIQASFEIMKKRTLRDGSIEIRYRVSFIYLSANLSANRDTVPIAIVQTIVNAATMSKWHADRIGQVRANECLLFWTSSVLFRDYLN